MYERFMISASLAAGLALSGCAPDDGPGDVSGTAGIEAGRQGSRTIYTDHFRVARTYADADPAGWGGP
jgi:hypothetical protein